MPILKSLVGLDPEKSADALPTRPTRRFGVGGEGEGVGVGGGVGWGGGDVSHIKSMHTGNTCMASFLCKQHVVVPKHTCSCTSMGKFAM